MKIEMSKKELLERVDLINAMARTNFDVASGMLAMLNGLCETEYDFLNKRVVRFENPEIGYSSPCHDLHAELWYEVEFLKERKDA